MMRKILTTGGKGFIGSHLNEVLEMDSYDVVDGQNVLNTNLLSSALEGKGTVIHLAALISANESIQKPGEYYSTNITGTDLVLRNAIQRESNLFIFASSAAIYNPENPYGLSKLIGEKILLSRKKDIKIIILRFFNVYGVGSKPEYAGVITKFFDAVKNKNDLVVSGDGAQTRDFIYIDDLAVIIRKIVMNSEKIPSGTIIEVGTGRSVSILELARVFAKKYHKKIVLDENQPKGVLQSKADLTELNKHLGRIEFTSLEDGIEKLASSLEIKQ